MAKSFEVLFPIGKHIFPIGFYIRYRGNDTLWISILRVRGRKMTQYTLDGLVRLDRLGSAPDQI